jgi:hypothetical protein
MVARDRFAFVATQRDLIASGCPQVQNGTRFRLGPLTGNR